MLKIKDNVDLKDLEKFNFCICENTIYGLQDCRDSYGIRLGEYKTKRRVLKVLSDIKRFIKFNNVSNKVFNMPEE